MGKRNRRRSHQDGVRSGLRVVGEASTWQTVVKPDCKRCHGTGTVTDRRGRLCVCLTCFDVPARG